MADAILEGKSNPAGDVKRAVAEGGGDEFVEVKEGAAA
ncbi:MAG TPA: 30S ribosomal protein S2, partial [Ramlibacter sp.]|nr:30S ribosomal protein S2 [Ramlibacter sp.]